MLVLVLAKVTLLVDFVGVARKALLVFRMDFVEVVVVESEDMVDPAVVTVGVMSMSIG